MKHTEGKPLSRLQLKTFIWNQQLAIKKKAEDRARKATELADRFDALIQNIASAPDLDGEATRYRLLAETLWGFIPEHERANVFAHAWVGRVERVAIYWANEEHEKADELEAENPTSRES